MTQRFIKILDTLWPVEPCRLIGCRVMNLKPVSEIPKKDKNISDFFKKTTSVEERKE